MTYFDLSTSQIKGRTWTCILEQGDKENTGLRARTRRMEKSA